MVNNRGRLDWRDAIVDYLVAAGTVGRKQKEITYHFRDYANAADIKAHLLALSADKRVQQFHISRGQQGRPYTVWRATDKIYDAEE